MSSQTNNTYQYWFDNDYDNLVEENTSSTIFEQSLDVSALSEGVHLFSYRVKKGPDGVWSAPMSHQFMKVSVGDLQQSQIAGYQYWFDGDIAHAISVDVNPGTTTIEAALDLTSLRYGVHTLSIRSRDNLDRWSEVLNCMFLKIEPGDFVDTDIAAYQYWFDQDDANAVRVNVEASTTIISPAIDASALADGAHTMYFRIIDTKDRWSSTLKHAFVKLNTDNFASATINAYQYWFDKNDAEAITQSIPAGTTTIDPTIDIPNISDGVHTLKFRVKDTEGHWSSILSHTFFKVDQAVYNAAKIASYQYWFDNDFTTAVTTSLDSQVKNLELNELINVDNVSLGDHILSIRFCDTEGRWSAIVNNDVTIGIVGEAVDLAYGENLVKNGETPALEGWKQKNGVVDGISYTNMVADALMNNYTTGYEGDHATNFDNQQIVFHGASNSNGYIYQDIRLDNFAPQTGNLKVDLYGTLSYYKGQGDYAGIEFSFYDENGILIGSKVHYTNKDHVWPNTTAYVLHDHTSSVSVPANTDYVRVGSYSVIKGSSGDNDGCVLQVGLKATSNLVTINYDTGTNGSSIDATSANYGEVAVSSVVPVKPGSIFLGWSSTEDGNVDFATGELFVHKDGMSYSQGETTLYAVWEEILTYTRPGLTADNYGTLCLPKGGTATGATIYSVAGKRVDADDNPTSLVLEEVTTLEAGKPYIFCATGDELKVTYSGTDISAEAKSENGLIGNFTNEADVTEGMYLLHENKLVKCGEGCKINANRAYLDMSQVSEYGGISHAPTRAIYINGNDALGIGLVEWSDEKAQIYSPSGMRIPRSTKGLMIINGNKVIKQ